MHKVKKDNSLTLEAEDGLSDFLLLWVLSKEACILTFLTNLVKGLLKLEVLLLKYSINDPGVWITSIHSTLLKFSFMLNYQYQVDC